MFLSWLPPVTSLNFTWQPLLPVSRGDEVVLIPPKAFTAQGSSCLILATLQLLRCWNRRRIEELTIACLDIPTHHCGNQHKKDLSLCCQKCTHTPWHAAYWPKWQIADAASSPRVFYLARTLISPLRWFDKVTCTENKGLTCHLKRAHLHPIAKRRSRCTTLNPIVYLTVIYCTDYLHYCWLLSHWFCFYFVIIDLKENLRDNVYCKMGHACYFRQLENGTVLQLFFNNTDVVWQVLVAWKDLMFWIGLSDSFTSFLQSIRALILRQVFKKFLVNWRSIKN